MSSEFALLGVAGRAEVLSKFGNRAHPEDPACGVFRVGVAVLHPLHVGSQRQVIVDGESVIGLNDIALKDVTVAAVGMAVADADPVALPAPDSPVEVEAAFIAGLIGACRIRQIPARAKKDAEEFAKCLIE